MKTRLTGKICLPKSSKSTSWFLKIPGIEESFHRHHLLTAALQVPNELTPATMVTDQQMDTPDGRKEARKFAKSNLVADFVWDG